MGAAHFWSGITVRVMSQHYPLTVVGRRLLHCYLSTKIYTTAKIKYVENTEVKDSLNSGFREIKC